MDYDRPLPEYAWFMLYMLFVGTVGVKVGVKVGFEGCELRPWALG